MTSIGCYDQVGALDRSFVFFSYIDSPGFNLLFKIANNATRAKTTEMTSSVTCSQYDKAIFTRKL